jgi:phospholipid/cholesterol/gamma-HCH transport system ATP-binding protein
VVIIEHLKKSFSGTEVLSDVNLTLNDGEVLTIIGMSGIGKSVLAKSIIGLIEPDGGRILLDGRDIAHLTEEQYNGEVRNQMSFIFQQGALWDSMTIEQNIQLALSVRKSLSRVDREELTAESLELVGLKPEVKNMYPEELSGGMIKRASIARAIAARPKYLLYDEPTTGLDPVLANMINDLIVKLHRELKTTSLIISHDIVSLQKFSQRVAMLHDGRIINVCQASEMWQQDNEIFSGFIRGQVGSI